MNVVEFVDLYTHDFGFNCIPLKNNSKEPAVASWKEYQTKPYDGVFKEGHNVGVLTGSISNIVVIDIDDRSLIDEVIKNEAGKPTIEDWKNKTFITESSRGIHIWVRPKGGKYPPTAKLVDSKGRGIDIKSEGGYVVAPPSIHPDGTKYRVLSNTREILEVDVEGFVRSLVKVHGFSGGLKKAKLTDVVKGAIPEGARNDSAYVMARYLLNPVEGGLEEVDAWTKLLEWNVQNQPPLEEDELRRVFDSAHNIPFEERPQEFNIKTFKRNYVARHVTVTLHPKTLRENEEIYVYKNGLYIDGGETHIKELLHRLYYGVPRNEVNELLATIRATTYVTNDDFDTHSELVHLKNCIINIKNLKVFEQSHELLTRNQIQTSYNPDAKCPTILKFLAQIMPDGEDLKTLIELLSSILLHKVKLEKAIIFVGDQANGKSTLIELIISILGGQNISNVSLQQLASNRFATQPMIGKILNAYGDLDIDSIKQTGMIKQIISHDSISVEKKNKDAFSTKIPIRLLFSANHLPDMPNADQAIYRRFWVVKFPIVIPPEKRDIKLLEKLTTPEEKSGFLNILLANASVLVKKNFKFQHHQALEKTKSLWREKSDSASGWLEKECVMNPDFKIKSVELYEYYRQWCLKNHEKVLSDKMLFGKIEGTTPARKIKTRFDGAQCNIIIGIKPKELATKELEAKNQTSF